MSVNKSRQHRASIRTSVVDPGASQLLARPLQSSSVSSQSFPARTLRWLETRPALRRLDRVAFGWALFLGLLLGLLAGVAILELPDGARFAVAAALIALASAVAWSAQPVGIWEAVEEAEPLLDMVAIEGGSFLMGSPEGEPDRRDNEQQHRVAVSAFHMGRTTVTKVQYREVMKLDAPGPGGDDHPVTGVSWYDAVAFCNRLSELEGQPPCYEIDGRKVAWIDDAGGYRLPTEAEWEYACRAGSTTPWSFGDDGRELGRYAWFEDNSDSEAHPVATLEPNPWDLCDLHGNVWEWCWNPYAPYGGRVWSRLIHFRLTKDPRGPAGTPVASRVLRGGAFVSGPRDLRSAVRPGVGPEVSGRSIGFRCVLRARRQP